MIFDQCVYMCINIIYIFTKFLYMYVIRTRIKLFRSFSLRIETEIYKDRTVEQNNILVNLQRE